jgi:hypothetical protein
MVLQTGSPDGALVVSYFFTKGLIPAIKNKKSKINVWYTPDPHPFFYFSFSIRIIHIR